jgi:hypothetical protein
MLFALICKVIEEKIVWQAQALLPLSYTLAGYLTHPLHAYTATQEMLSSRSLSA